MANLAAKYRPKSFQDITEQSVIVNMLENICAQDNLSHRNFLFIGPAGCGKTTTGRIVASVLNDGKGDVIEVDAASHNGVEAARELVKQMRTFPVGCKYKVFIFDECFGRGSAVKMADGSVKSIESIKIGDHIRNMYGTGRVTNVFANIVKTSNLVCVSTSVKPLITTKGHLFFTEDGWVEAKDLKEGDILYDYSSMQEMWDRIPGSVLFGYEDVLQQIVQIRRDSRSADWTNDQLLHQTVSYLRERVQNSEEYQREDLFKRVWCDFESSITRISGEQEKDTCTLLAYIYMSSLWKANGDSEQRYSSDMQSEMRRHFEEARARRSASEADVARYLRMVWDFIRESVSSENLQQQLPESTCREESCREREGKIVYSDEVAQSFSESRDSKENAANSYSEWFQPSKRSCDELWERALLEASTLASSESRYELGTGVRSSISSSSEQSREVCYELQTRPRISRNEGGCRGGWCRTLSEQRISSRCKEGNVFGKVRVESVTCYERGSNDELFRSCGKDLELGSGYVTLYDLEVSGHPSYFVNDVLVHNCHSFSSTAWQVMLKPIEEQPARTVIILCTTNPEKIPATILSRVQTFQLSKISLDGIIARLEHIVEEENKLGQNITYTDDAIGYIAKLANGGMRDAITLLEKSLSFSKDITIENLTKSLDLPNYDDYFTLLNGIAKKDNQTIVKIINDVYNSGINFVKWFEGFHSFIANIIKYIFMQDINATMIPSHYQEKIASYSTAHATLCLKLANKLVKMNQELKNTQYLQELAITYLCVVPQK